MKVAPGRRAIACGLAGIQVIDELLGEDQTGLGLDLVVAPMITGIREIRTVSIGASRPGAEEIRAVHRRLLMAADGGRHGRAGPGQRRIVQQGVLHGHFIGPPPGGERETAGVVGFHIAPIGGLASYLVEEHRRADAQAVALVCVIREADLGVGTAETGVAIDD